MGYSTTFTNQLNFKTPLTEKALETLRTFMNEDVRIFGDWVNPTDTPLTYIHLKITEDETGIKWNGNEKTYNMPELINFVTFNMIRKGFHDFRLEGELFAYGEKPEDVWKITMIDGVAKVQTIKP